MAEYASARLGLLKHCLSFDQPLASATKHKAFLMSVDGEYETRAWLDAILSTVHQHRDTVIGAGAAPFHPN